MALSKISGTTGIADATITSVKLADFAQAVDLNGVELILDADQDTSITADTDDRIDFKIANVEHFSFSNSSGDTVVKPMVDAKDIIFQQFDGNKILEINDGNFVGIGGNSAGGGEIRIYEDTDNGNHYTGFKAGNNTASVAYTLPLADGTSDFKLTTDGSGVLSWTASHLPTSADGQALGSATLEWSDLFLADSSTIQFGADQDVTLTHLPDAGIMLNTTMQLRFRDSAISIGSPADGDLDINADDEIELNSTLIDVNGNLDVSGTIVSAGTISGTLATAAQGNVTSLGTLTALTVDDVAVDGKVITMTGSTDDTFTTTVAANGATSLVTVDTAGAAANLQITADGTVDIDSAGVLTLDSGAAINIEPASGSAILLDGTISVDAGVVTGATSITSTAFVGGLTGNVTGNASGTALTVTQAAQTAITSLGTLTTLTVDDITINGSTISDGGDFTLDVEGDINLDANGADIVFKDAGTSILTMTNDSTDFVMTVATQDKDFVIKGDDGGSPITPFKLDMSAGGDLFLGGGLIDLKNDGSNVSQIKFYCESSNAHAQTLIGAVHSLSANNTLTLPDGDDGNLLSSGKAITHGSTATEHGPGAIATSFAPITRRSIFNGVITTKIHFDLTALGAKGATANDVIGLPAGGNAFIGRYVTSTYGIVYKAELACIELPAVASGTVTTDIDIATNSSGTIAYDAAGGTAKLFNTGGMVAGQELSNITPALTANNYFYLVEGDTAATDAVYNAGQFILTLYGHAIS